MADGTWVEPGAGLGLWLGRVGAWWFHSLYQGPWSTKASYSARPSMVPSPPCPQLAFWLRPGNLGGFVQPRAPR